MQDLAKIRRPVVCGSFTILRNFRPGSPDKPYVRQIAAGEESVPKRVTAHLSGVNHSSMRISERNRFQFGEVLGNNHVQEWLIIGAHICTP
jgi:hypothetical protein